MPETCFKPCLDACSSLSCSQARLPISQIKNRIDYVPWILLRAPEPFATALLANYMSESVIHGRTCSWKLVRYRCPFIFNQIQAGLRILFMRPEPSKWLPDRRNSRRMSDSLYWAPSVQGTGDLRNPRLSKDLSVD